MPRYVQCENQGTDNKETKDVVGRSGGRMKETIIWGKEENDVWRNRSMCADYRYSFSSFFHDESLPLFQIDLRTLSRQMEGSERVYIDNPKNTKKKISYLSFSFPCSQRSFPKRWARLIVCVLSLLFFWILLLFFRRKTNSVLAFLSILVELITFPIGCRQHEDG